MELILIVGLVLLAVGLGVGFAIVLRRLREIEQSRANDQSAVLLNQNIQGMQERIDATTKAINERLDRAATVVGQVHRELGTMSQIGTQLTQFQDFLKSPKLRGGLGEQGLKDMLAQALPAEMLRFQYRFTTGDIVDAAIKLQAGIVPIDAKFPLENFNRYLQSSDEREKTNYANAFRRDFRGRVNEISKKYLLPDEGTVDFAVMYVPSESVYYELVTNDKFRDLYDHAAAEKVIVTSPATFFYYLRTIMVGLEGQRLNRMAHQVLTTVRAIQQETHKFGDGVRVLGKHITNAKNVSDSVQSDYIRLAEKVDRVLQLDAPDTAEGLAVGESQPTLRPPVPEPDAQ
ncbi:DNA recombination protein RmuC [Candidatus Berkelbacteria bacterium]|nr:DNA recombination protein RmuC [Candidatus Berkelbacteria bacterium]